MGLLVVVAGGCKHKAPGAAGAPASVSAPNILLISIDSLRADRLGCYGADRPTSPNLDRFALAAARFTRALANAPWTLPSHVTMLTGQEVSVHDIDRSGLTLGANATTIAAVLRARGYATAAVVTAPYLRAIWGYEHGFDAYDDGLSAVDFQTSHRWKTASLAVDRALRAVRDRRGKPWFVFLHLFDVHYDYTPPAPYRTMFVEASYRGHFDVGNWETNAAFRPDMDPADFAYVRAQYDGGVAWADSQVGRLFAALQADGDWANTAVIVTADHGEEFLEHRGKGHGHSVFNELLHVPLLLKAPGAPAAATIAAPVSLVDIFPTIAGWGGASLAGYRGSGRSLLPLLRDPAAGDADRALFAETNLSRLEGLPDSPRGREAMVERGGWKYLERRDPPDRRLLFHIADDAGERVDRLAEEPARAAELRALLFEHLRANRALRDALRLARDQPIDERTAEQLKQLGYIN
jgi:arylsulfatase A-like enzyme